MSYDKDFAELCNWLKLKGYIAKTPVNGFLSLYDKKTKKRVKL